jgi:hypothetical protein
MQEVSTSKTWHVRCCESDLDIIFDMGKDLKLVVSDTAAVVSDGKKSVIFYPLLFVSFHW